jgi:RimJ/RimL family protein N-acetyltransferase
MPIQEYVKSNFYRASASNTTPALELLGPYDVRVEMTSTGKGLETPRLILRRFSLDDAAFVFRLVNDPAWLEHIGDRKVRTLEDARAYLRRGALAMYETMGFGMYVVALKESGEPIGTCGLVKRDGLDDVDIGFAFLPQYRGQGFAFESAAAVLGHARALGLKRIVAIVSAANHRSIRILEKIGLTFERMVKLPGEDEEIPLYAYQRDDAQR